jgi:hypothetical protein
LKTQRILGNVVAAAVVGVLAVGAPSAAHAQGAKPTATATTTAKPPAAPTTTAKPPTPPPAGTGAKPPTTGAAPAANDPKALYADGEKKYKAGDFAGALVSFQGAEAVKAAPQAERYIGLCHDNLGHYADAVTFYEKFLAAVPPKMTKEGDEIKARVATIKAMPAKIHFETTPAGASILVDGKQMGVTPADVDVTPGKHIVKLELAGYLPVDRDLDVTYGAKQDVKSDLQAKPAEPPPPPPVAANPPPADKPAEPAKPPEPPKEKPSKVPAFITGGLAVAAVGVGTVFGILALGKQSDFKSSPNADTADTGENFALVADMSFGIAITLGVTSLVLFLTNDDEPAKAATSAPVKKASNPWKNLTIAPIVTTQGGGAGASFRF